MNILFIVPYVPNLIRVRSFNFIRWLTMLGHRVSVVTIWTTESERKDLTNLQNQCYQVVAKYLPKYRSFYNCTTALPTKVPLQAAYSWQPSLAALILELVQNGDIHEEYDVVHVEHLRGAKYGIFLREYLTEHQLKIPVIWDSVDNISHLFRQSSKSSKKRISRLITRFELSRTEKYESWLANQFDSTIVTSQVDLDSFHDLVGSGERFRPISIIPNGVDLEYFTPAEDSTREPATLVISGKMSYHANVSMVFELVENIFPIILAKRPDAKLWIVGKDPVQDILSLDIYPNITVTGTVQDIRPFLQKATVAVAPLTYGAGIQNKVLEAMACSTPVVAYPQGVAALSVVAEKDMLLGKTPHDFAMQVLRLLDNCDLRNDIGRNGRRFVEKNHNWKTITIELLDLYKQAIEHKAV